MAVLILAGCSMSSNTATVTINTGLYKHAAIEKMTLVDRLLAFLSFSTKVQADPPPVGLGINVITIIITGPGMAELQASAPIETGSITLEVPAGANRRFTAVAFSGTSRIMGGISTVNLNPGEETTVQILMGQFPPPPDSFFGSGNYPNPIQLNWSYTPSDPIGLVGFKLYRAPDLVSGIPADTHGPYAPIVEGRKEDFGSSTYTYPDVNIDNSLFKYLYYKIAAINEFGEGEPAYLQHFYC
jgi:hypothetical protein